MKAVKPIKQPVTEREQREALFTYQLYKAAALNQIGRALKSVKQMYNPNNRPAY